MPAIHEECIDGWMLPLVENGKKSEDSLTQAFCGQSQKVLNFLDRNYKRYQAALSFLHGLVY